MSNKVNIYIADYFHPSGISLLQKKYPVFSFPGLTAPELIKKITKTEISANPDYSVLIVRSVRKIDKKFLHKLRNNTKVNLVCTVSAGYDNVDTITAKKNHIDVMNVAGANSTSAAEFTFSLILAAAKKLLKADKLMKSGVFDYSVFSNTELKGKTIGIIGVGRIGSKVAKYARAFNMKILGNDINPLLKQKYRFIEFVSIGNLLRRSDYITIHTPLDNSTRYLINSNNLKFCKPNAVLINCSRGGTVNEKALMKFLNKNKLSYAGIDVFENEPHFEQNFRKLSNVILTPHLAGKTIESKERMAVTAAKKIIKYINNPQKRTALID